MRLGPHVHSFLTLFIIIFYKYKYPQNQHWNFLNETVPLYISTYIYIYVCTSQVGVEVTTKSEARNVIIQLNLILSYKLLAFWANEVYVYIEKEEEARWRALKGLIAIVFFIIYRLYTCKRAQSLRVTRAIDLKSLWNFSLIIGNSQIQ